MTAPADALAAAASAPTETRLRVLVVEDDPDDLLLCRAAILRSPDLRCELRTAGTLREAIGQLEDGGADVALVDLSLPDAQGLDAITALTRRFEELPIVVLTGLRDEQAAAQAIHAGAQDYLIKGSSQSEFVGRAIRFALERKQAEQARKAKELAEAANQAKSMFLSRMSHELRTPLTAVLGFAQLLEQDGDPARSELAGHIVRAGQHLHALINEVLDLARIDAGELTMSLAPVRLADVVSDVAALILPMANGRGITVRVDAASADEYVVVDRQRLFQVLLNLASNAVKYNREAGCVEVRARAGGPGRIRLEIRDTGPGLTQKQLSSLFVPFERLDAGERDIEGTGLGLVIAKRLVEVMGGAIGLDSAPGAGTTAWTEWATVPPPRATDESEPARSIAPGNAQATVLYIEDNRVNIALVESVLTYRPGIRLLTAMTARAGIERAARERPALILLDLNLPDMPGDRALAEFRANPATEAIPVIVVSADANPSSRDRMLGAGASGYVTKPFDVAQFLRQIDDAITTG